MHRAPILPTTLRTGLRAVRAARRHTGSTLRKALLHAEFPNIEFRGRVYIGPRCDIYAAPGSRMIIVDCAIAPGVSLTTSPGAELRLEADFVGPNSVIVAREQIHIEGGSKIAEQVTVRDANHDRSLPLARKAFVSSPVRIGRNVWIGAKATVLSGTQIGDDATVAAGAVVVSDVPPGSIVGGIPARALKSR